MARNDGDLPSGAVNDGDLPMKNGDFPWLSVSLPEGISISISIYIYI